MSQYDEDEDDFDIDSSTLADIRKALRASEKRNKAYEQELQSFRSESRRRDLQGEISSRGLNPKIAAFVPADLDASALAGWLDEFGDVFAPAGAVQDPGSMPEAPEGTKTFQDLTNTGTPPIGDEAQQIALIKGITTKEELDAFIANSR